MLRSLKKCQNFLVHSTFDQRQIPDYLDLNSAIHAAKRAKFPFNPHDVWVVNPDSSAADYVKNFGLPKRYFPAPEDRQLPKTHQFRKLISEIDKALILYYPEKDLTLDNWNFLVLLHRTNLPLYVHRFK